MTAPWGNLVAALSNHSSSFPVNLDIKGMHAFKADLLGVVWREFLTLETKRATDDGHRCNNRFIVYQEQVPSGPTT
jgi:hypothetical protein